MSDARSALDVSQNEVDMFISTLRAKGTPWGDGCASLVNKLWTEVQERRIEVEKYKAWAASCDPAPPAPPTSNLVSRLRDLSNRLRDSGRYSADECDLAGASLIDEAIAALHPETRDEAPLFDALQWVLPMARGYAAEHPVGRNGEIVASAERVAESWRNQSPVKTSADPHSDLPLEQS